MVASAGAAYCRRSNRCTGRLVVAVAGYLVPGCLWVEVVTGLSCAGYQLLRQLAAHACAARRHLATVQQRLPSAACGAALLAPPAPCAVTTGAPAPLPSTGAAPPGWAGSPAGWPAAAAGWAGAACGVHPGTWSLMAAASWAEGTRMSRTVLVSKATWSCEGGTPGKGEAAGVRDPE